MFDEREALVRETTNRERGVWEELIFREAERAGVKTAGRSAGQVVVKMADLLVELEKSLYGELENEQN